MMTAEMVVLSCSQERYAWKIVLSMISYLSSLLHFARDLGMRVFCDALKGDVPSRKETQTFWFLSHHWWVLSERARRLFLPRMLSGSHRVPTARF